MKKSVLVILPTYNEAENIGLMLDEIIKISKIHKKYAYDILVVDDESPDGTSDIVKDYQYKYKNITLITGKKNGLGSAYIRGINFGLESSKYYAFIMMDSDFSHEPSVIPIFLEKLIKGNDCVIGSRYTKGGFIPGNWPVRRILNSKLANYLARLFVEFDHSITDLTGGFKAVKVESLSKVDIDSFDSSGYFFQVRFLYALTKLNMRIEEVPIYFADRERGTSKMSMFDILEFLKKIYLLNPDSRIRKIISFGAVGAIGTFVNIISLSFLLKITHMDPTISDAIAIELSIISNFYFNDKYTFSKQSKNIGKSSKINDFWKFNLGVFAGSILSLSIFTVLFKSAHVNYLVADLLAILISFFWNYWISIKYVWKLDNAIS
jgi:dolichol-phosphate mannosyltransferase